MWIFNPLKGIMKLITSVLAAIYFFFLSLCGMSCGPQQPASEFHSFATSKTQELSGAGAPSITLFEPKCVNIYLADQARQFFRENTHPPASCYGPLLAESWPCQSAQQTYSVVLYQERTEGPLQMWWRVEPGQAPVWRFTCKYNNACTRISCEKL